MESTSLTKPIEFLKFIQDKIDNSGVTTHIFFHNFKSKQLTKNQLQRFALQWYLTARDHKLAFPAIVFNTPDDNIRFELIDILYDEYGKGNKEKIHAKLLLKFLMRLGISNEEIENTAKLSAVTKFGEDVLKIWKEANPVYAFGLHYSLEYTAQFLHSTFAEGLSKYPEYTVDDLEYFNYHKIAEQVHTDFSEVGFLTYSGTNENQYLLELGVDKGINLLNDLWVDFDNHIFKSHLQ